MNLIVNRESDVPLHDQLCAQIGQMVASGALAAGQRLPSVRALATRVGVHHNTIRGVYQALARQGVLDVRQGSGVRVGERLAPVRTWRSDIALKAMAAQYVDQALSAGHHAAAILAACQEALAPPSVTQVVVVNPHPDLQALYRFELKEHLAMPVAGHTVDEVAGMPESEQLTTCFLTSTNHMAALQAVLADGVVPVILTLASIQPMLDRVRELTDAAVVAVVSASSRFQVLVPEFLAAVCDSERLLVVDAADRDRWAKVARLADLVIVDTSVASRVVDTVGSHVFAFGLIAEQTWADLGRRLPPTAFKS